MIRPPRPLLNDHQGEPQCDPIQSAGIGVRIDPIPRYDMGPPPGQLYVSLARGGCDVKNFSYLLT